MAMSRIEVIEVVRLTGDRTRRYFESKVSPVSFAMLSLNKSVSIDPRYSRGKDVLKALVKRADVGKEERGQ